MCGIVGVVSFAEPVADSVVSHAQQACDMLAHRGPDGDGLLVRSHAVLGHRRLAILDLSDAGRQPMGNTNRRVWVVCNGEIYNHLALRADLEQRGYEFHSHCDTETLIHGYDAWGIEGLVEKLRGMFAFGLWDEGQRRLWLVRDRLGVKPLFYIAEPSRILFASELGPLMSFGRRSAEDIDPLSLDCYLTFGYVPPDRSIWRDVHKVPPASIVLASPEGVRTTTYWSLPEYGGSKEVEHDIESRVTSAIIDAVAVRLESDVPLGAFLSGGIDSGLVTGLAAEQLSTPLTTLSVGFDGDEDNELGLARLVADRYATDHHELVVGGRDIHDLPRLISIVGEPFADSSLIPTAAVCRAARQRVSVALTGDGGDEMFGGYYRVAASFWGDRCRLVLGQAGSEVGSRLLRAVSGRGILQRAGTVMQYGGTDLVDLYAEVGAVFSSAERQFMLAPDWLGARGASSARTEIEQRVERVRGLPLATAYARIDQTFRLPAQYLVKLDSASSAHGLECRSPFLDQQVAETVAHLPMRTLLRRGRQKGLLRHVARRHLPSAVVHARKRGFGPNLDTWLKGVAGTIIQQLRPFAIGQDGPLSGSAVESLLDAYKSGANPSSHQVWTLLCFEIWWRTFVAPHQGLGPLHGAPL